MKAVRVGVVGLGYMGLMHAGCLADGSVDGAVLAGLCSRGEGSRAKAAAAFPGVATYERLDALLDAGTCDALIIVTPHLDHPQMVRAAFKADVHVLVEKPLAVSVKAAREVIAEHARCSHLKF